MLGELYAGSGVRTALGPLHSIVTNTGTNKALTSPKKVQFPLDWALIKLNTEREMLQNIMPPQQHTQRIASAQEARRISTVLPLKRCDNWSVIPFPGDVEDIEVTKYGRSSGWSYGWIAKGGRCPSYLSLERLTENENSAVATTYKFSEANVGHFVPTNDYSGFSDKDFVKPGDSGSIVVHAPSGIQLGLLFGQSASGQGMVLPLDMVFNDIAQVTGQKLIISPKIMAPAEMFGK